MPTDSVAREQQLTPEPVDVDDIVADSDTEMEQLQRVTVAVSRALKSTYFEPGT